MENNLPISCDHSPPLKIEHLFRIFIIGDLGVGKTSIILRYTENSFEESPNLPVNFKVKLMTIENKGIKLQLWDTKGEEKFGKIN